jgi:hypothetical protein
MTDTKEDSMNLKFTGAERKRIRLWLEKNVEAEDKENWFIMEREDGDLTIRRVTQYLPGGKWKVRIAYTDPGGFPIAMSGPLMAESNNKSAPDSETKIAFKSVPWEDLKWDKMPKIPAKAKFKMYYESSDTPS